MYLSSPIILDSFRVVIVSKESSDALYEGRYNESIFNCATATESMFIPIISAWLKKQLFHQRDNDVSRVLMETPTAIKYELLFGSVKGDLLSVHPSLLHKKAHYKSAVRLPPSGWAQKPKFLKNALAGGTYLTGRKNTIIYSIKKLY